MKLYELKDIAERYVEIVNPTTPEKVVAVGRTAGLGPGRRVIDLGSGYGEVLALWGEAFGIQGVGIDIRETACQRAREKVGARGLAGRIEIVCGNVLEYAVEPFSFDVAACIGSTFIWPSFAAAVRALKQAVRPGGRVVVGRVYWQHGEVPARYAQQKVPVYTEPELLRMMRAEGGDVECVVRASHADWDRYQSDTWRALLDWIEDHPEHPERQRVIDTLREDQEEYFGTAREHLGWAMYVMRTADY